MVRPKNFRDPIALKRAGKLLKGPLVSGKNRFPRDLFPEVNTIGQPLAINISQVGLRQCLEILPV